jgi:hypothetical protein
MTYCHTPFQGLEVTGASVARQFVVTDGRRLTGCHKAQSVTQQTDFMKLLQAFV